MKAFSQSANDDYFAWINTTFERTLNLWGGTKGHLVFSRP